MEQDKVKETVAISRRYNVLSEHTSFLGVERVRRGSLRRDALFKKIPIAINIKDIYNGQIFVKTHKSLLYNATADTTIEDIKNWLQ